MANEDDEEKIKVILLGESEVGKTNLINITTGVGFILIVLIFFLIRNFSFKLMKMNMQQCYRHINLKQSK